MLDLGQIYTFLAVVEHGGFSRAAAAIGSTQPVVSQQVRKLEVALGARLLIRSHVVTVPSVDGNRFLPYARALIRTEARARGSIDGNQLVVAASGNVGTYLLPKLIGAFKDQFPMTEIELLYGTNAEAIDHVEVGAADVGLTEWWDDRRGFLGRIWHREPLVVIVPPNHPWARRGSVKRTELFDESMIGGEPGTGTRRLLEEKFGKSIDRLKMGASLGSTAAVKEAVKAGLGISLVMKAAIEEETKNGSLVALKITTTKLEKELYTIVSADQPETALGNRFASFLLGAL